MVLNNSVLLPIFAQLKILNLLSMKKNYHLFLVLFTLVSIHVKSIAQNWTVGVPVDIQLSSLTKYSGFCAPQADFNINAVCNQVDGIQYIITIDTLVDIAIYTANNDTVELGDTLFLSAGNNNYSFSFINGPGNITFNLKAYGTPTTAGQTHQCNFSNMWMSNMMLCNEQLTFNMQNDCTVDAATGLNNLTNSTPIINFPNNNNQYQLQISGVQNSSLIKLTDVTGKQIEVNQKFNQSNVQIPCQNLNSGIYFLTLVQNNKTQSYKFLITK